ncbi:uncharacterized protein G2W53_014465 [Senna tora]|uniref:Uncharacterized protein n=1 Tax=Senna tora TaxID=362788 RepID=A0A834WTJ0_9FABA|nr:uncharacterized protein G2W53_014465 [Senna tora]
MEHSVFNCPRLKSNGSADIGISDGWTLVTKKKSPGNSSPDSNGKMVKSQSNSNIPAQSSILIIGPDPRLTKNVVAGKYEIKSRNSETSSDQYPKVINNTHREVRRKEEIKWGNSFSLNISKANAIPSVVVIAKAKEPKIADKRENMSSTLSETDPSPLLTYGKQDDTIITELPPESLVKSIEEGSSSEKDIVSQPPVSNISPLMLSSLDQSPVSLPPILTFSSQRSPASMEKMKLSIDLRKLEWNIHYFTNTPVDPNRLFKVIEEHSVHYTSPISLECPSQKAYISEDVKSDDQPSPREETHLIRKRG